MTPKQDGLYKASLDGILDVRQGMEEEDVTTSTGVKLPKKVVQERRKTGKTLSYLSSPFNSPQHTNYILYYICYTVISFAYLHHHIIKYC